MSPTDPQVRAAVWWTCPTKDCASRHVAVTVSVDGFRTRVVADRVWRSVPAVTVDGEGNAVVASYGGRVEVTLVRPDGSTVDVRRSPDEAPVVEGEIVAGVEHGRRGTSFLATDPGTATAHAIPVPADARQLERLSTGQLRALTLRRTYAWSDDGGVTWVESAGASDGTLLQSFTTSAPDVHVLVGGSDGATLFPFGEIRRLDDAGLVVGDAPAATRRGPTSAPPRCCPTVGSSRTSTRGATTAGGRARRPASTCPTATTGRRTPGSSWESRSPRRPTTSRTSGGSTWPATRTDPRRDRARRPLVVDVDGPGRDLDRAAGALTRSPQPART